ncbi:unnamed protein product [Lactuca virosa]|uniref:Signal peptidase complex subunit 1 n=1 Tax=Lactuca virosa TaxID=75947 RepID=A0AAU9N7I9_9ASTR|nr:unnamed protein product [Lactuca virosa]
MDNHLLPMENCFSSLYIYGTVFRAILFLNKPNAYIHSPSAFTMDWQGQKVAEQLMQILLVVFAVAAFITGYVVGSFQLMLFVYAGGVVLTTLITIPNWPFFNKHPLKWLDPSEAEKHPKPQVAVTSVSKKKPTKK